MPRRGYLSLQENRVLIFAIERSDVERRVTPTGHKTHLTFILQTGSLYEASYHTTTRHVNKGVCLVEATRL
jgi:hypothetical protein